MNMHTFPLIVKRGIEIFLKIGARTADFFRWESEIWSIFDILSGIAGCKLELGRLTAEIGDFADGLASSSSRFYTLDCRCRRGSIALGLSLMWCYLGNQPMLVLNDGFPLSRE